MVLDLVLKCLFFVYRCGKAWQIVKRQNLKSREEIKKLLLHSMIIDENLEFDDLNKEAEEVQGPDKAAKIIKRYEDIIKTKNKGIINVAYHQG